jgi:hypothetical protein
MRKQGTDRFVRFGAAVLAVALAGVLAAAAARTEGSPAPSASPTPAPSPAPSPDPSPSPVPAASPEPAGAPPAGEELPRIIRTVCTDRVCGGCDGKCRASSGHVAVDKKGRCCCTPTDGSALDRAIRQAYQRHPPL